ncbi:unnamed protein product [Cyclocybe aegerita]|uniref:Uncharacterized protein n=1 Tax=Cyclocybe aegerita TaxID=1973307 RepID=A0A8S0VY67_CYCAE|nr:unnamed protein product [Cyclocybe aegerita]
MAPIYWDSLHHVRAEEQPLEAGLYKGTSDRGGGVTAPFPLEFHGLPLHLSPRFVPRTGSLFFAFLECTSVSSFIDTACLFAFLRSSLHFRAQSLALSRPFVLCTLRSSSSKMFGKFLTPASLLVGLSLLHQVRAHTALIPMLSVAGTPERDDVQRPNNRNPCGRDVDVTAAAVEGSTAAVADATGAFTVTATNFNRRRDGSRQVTAQVDPTATGQNFVAMTVTVNGDPAPRQLGSEQLTATLPAGMTCTGGTAGNKCLVQFVTLSGFGNCVVVEQAAQDAGAAAGAAAGGAAAGGVAATGAATNVGDNTVIGATGAANTGVLNNGGDNTALPNANTGVVNNGGDNTALPATGTANTGVTNNGGDNTALPNAGTVNAGTVNTEGDNTAIPATGTGNTRVANTGATNAGTANTGVGNTRVANAGAANRGATAGTANTGAARTANVATANTGRVSGPAAANVAGTRAPRAARALEQRAGRKSDDDTGCVEEFKRSLHEWLWA